MTSHFAHRLVLQGAVEHNIFSSACAWCVDCLQQEKSDVPNGELSHVVAGVRVVAGQVGRVTQLPARLAPGMLLPTDTRTWWRYPGSLTTPSCEQGVLWTVFQDTLPVSRDQIKDFQKILQSGSEYLLKNFRAPQPLKHRVVLYQDPGHHKDGQGAAGSLRASGGLLLLLLLLLVANFAPGVLLVGRLEC